MERILKEKKKIYYFNSTDKLCTIHFSNKLFDLLNQHTYENQPVVILCIGSDRVTGDSLGPLIGHQLNKIQQNRYTVLGTLESPVHAKNLAETIKWIETTYVNPFIIAIDASLGKSDHVGYITLGEGSLKPGAGVSKDLPCVGDLFITGIVNLSGVLDHMLLQSTRLNVVMKLAECISLGIRFSFHTLYK